MQLITFHNMQPEEFFRLNRDVLPKEIQEKYEVMVDTLKDKDATISSNNRTIELLEEQLYFARELVQQVDNFVESNLTKAKQNMYHSFRDESYFEV